MNKPLILKIVALIAIVMALMLPLAAIESAITERAQYRHEAVASVQRSFVGPQTLVAPVWVWPYREEWETQRTSDDGRRVTVTKHSENRRWLVYFDDSSVAGDVQVLNDRYRGLHRVRTYESKLRIESRIRAPDPSRVKPEKEGGRLIWDRPAVVLGIADLRGVRGTPVFTLDGSALEVAAGTFDAIPGSGIHAAVAVSSEPKTLTLNIELHLAGMESLAIVPTARVTDAALSANWPHAKYAGAFLPSRKATDRQGSSATWSIPALASGVQAVLTTEAARAAPNSFSVEFIEPINVYRLADRATKYGALLIALVIAAVFLLDVIQRLDIHAMQYGLVGLALAIFFLLLLALSEHVDFMLAYVAAASACTLLVAIYMRHALQSTRRSATLALALTAVYGAIYAILIAEELALLMGALLLFAVLTTIMIATRKLNWSKLAIRAPATGNS